jgi:meso-butanediol dehydrogenase / (S,S)-butanediol dehydrogenase / diacetyl reductase
MRAEVTHVTRVAVVTGAARGIGLAIAGSFLARGDAVAMLDIDAASLASAAATLVATHGDRVLALPCDVSAPEQVRQTMAQAEQHFGRIDALVNNAGVAVFKPLVDTSFDEWRHVMATNLDGPFLCSAACVPVMRKVGGGSIVNITSISGLRASTLRVAYGTSKAALAHFTRQQAVELAMHGIRVNAVAPGPVETAMAKKVHSAEIRKDYHDTIPLARYGSEEEIASAVVFLCSPQASYVTGQVLAVDGGFDAAGVGLPTLRRDFGDA